MADDHDDLHHRFNYHPPSSEHVVGLHQQVRRLMLGAADELAHVLPEGQERSLALTKLEEAMMWANASIARNQPPEPTA